MEIACLVGPTGTEGDRLLRSLLRDADALAGRGVVVPGPGPYRRLLAEALKARVQGLPAELGRKVVLEAALDGAEAPSRGPG